MVGIVAAIGAGIVSSLIASGIEAGAGWVLKGIEGDTGASEAEALGKELSYIENAIDGLRSDLAKDTAEIMNELKVINQEQLYTAWEVRDSDLQKYITAINVQYSRYVSYAKNPTTTKKSDVAQLVTEILDTNSGAAVAMAQISTLLAGSGSDKSVLQLYREMTGPVIVNSTIHGSEAMNSYFQYYINASYAQCRALYLLIEAFHYKNNDALAETQYCDYRALAKAQEMPFISNVQYFLRDSMLGGALTGHQGGFATTVQYNTSAQDYWAKTYYASGYDPTEARAKAERIFSNSLAMKKGENRIAVNMVYGTGLGDGTRNLNHVTVPLVSASDALGKEFGPARIDMINIPSESKSIAGHPFSTDQLTLKRMVYENLPGDAYIMKDMNGEASLKPQAGSGTKYDYFQAPKYLKHQMIVNEVSKNTSMDFASFHQQRALS